MGLWDRFINWKRGKFGGTLVFHMKSGKALKVRGVAEYDIKYEDQRVSEVSVKYMKRTVTRVIVRSINCAEVAAIEIQ